MDKLTLVPCYEATIEELRKAFKGYSERTGDWREHVAIMKSTLSILSKSEMPAAVAYRVFGEFGPIVSRFNHLSGNESLGIFAKQVLTQLNGREDPVIPPRPALSRFLRWLDSFFN